VLGRFPAEEEPLMREALADAAKACEMFVLDELSAAMNLFNKKKKQEKNESVSGTITGDK
jgi:PTH1 family peptidyl-tRNA hydrolase